MIRSMSHDEIVEWARSSARGADEDALVGGFVMSLGTRRLDRRSALGSYAAIRHLPMHAFTASRAFDPSRCRVCGLREAQDVDVDALAKLRIEQDSLIRFTDVLYAAFDVATFAALAHVTIASADDWARLDGVFTSMTSLPATCTLKDLQPAISKTFPSNKRERQYVLEALGVMGILCPPEIPSFFDTWIERDAFEQLQPAHYYARDSAYPLQHWSGKSGVHGARLRAWFGPDRRAPSASVAVPAARPPGRPKSASTRKRTPRR